MKFWNHSKDIEREKDRYNFAASLDNSTLSESSGEGFSHFPQHHAPAFKQYYSWIEEELVNVRDVLEIGAGTGQHTRPVVTTFTNVTALDISNKSLEKLQRKFGDSVKTVVGNIEQLPLPDSSFDLVVSCGVLSYGDASKVDHEILRVLRPGGTFIFVDSLNHNPIFKFNRWLKFLSGERSLSTVLRIPKMARFRRMSNFFDYSLFSYFGKWIWMYPILAKFLGSEHAMRIYGSLEKNGGASRYAFKIVGKFKGKKC